MRDKRLVLLSQWLGRDLGMEIKDLCSASSDASFRRYFRFQSGDSTYVAMDAPPDLEDCRPFLQVSRKFLALGIHVPEVLECDLKQGFLLLTDLGKQTYLQGLSEENADRLYQDAIVTLIKIQLGGMHSSGVFPAYDAAMLSAEMQLFADWLLDRHLRVVLNHQQIRAWGSCQQWLVEQALSQPVTWLHRDYHSRNLMVCLNHNPGVLDFQDAVEGPLTYDLVSLLKDCYILWPRQKILEWLGFYRLQASQAGLELPAQTKLIEWFDLMGVQRHLKAAGIFARLFYRDQKSGYLDDIPRVLGYIMATAQRYPQLSILNKLCQHALEVRT